MILKKKNVAKKLRKNCENFKNLTIKKKIKFEVRLEIRKIKNI
jgi:hypothetical protein